MSIARKSRAQQHCERLEKSLDSLKSVLLGSEPNVNIWNLYAYNEGDYKRDFTEIDDSELSIAIAGLESVIKELKKAKALKATKLHTSV